MCSHHSSIERALGASHLVVVAAAAVLAGCSLLYSFNTPLSDGNAVDALRARLTDVLAKEGYEQLGPGVDMVGATGCGMRAADRTIYMAKPADGRKTGRVGGYDDAVVVYQFTCNGEWQVMILWRERLGASEEADRLRNALKTAFAAEIASGTMQVHTQCYLNLS